MEHVETKGILAKVSVHFAFSFVLSPKTKFRAEITVKLNISGRMFIWNGSSNEFFLISDCLVFAENYVARLAIGYIDIDDH